MARFVDDVDDKPGKPVVTDVTMTTQKMTKTGWRVTNHQVVVRDGEKVDNGNGESKK